MKYLRLLIFLFCACFFSKVNGQSISNEGTAFWTVFPPHDKSNGNGASEATMFIFVTSRYNSEVTVSCGTYSEKKTIPANTSVSFEVPRSLSYTGFTNANAITNNKGIHVVVTEGKPKVSVYGHMFASARSAASLILPVESLGQQYFSVNYTQDGTNNDVAKNYLILQAVESNTDIILTDLAGSATRIHFDNPGDLYVYDPNSKSDLTGMRAEVDPATSSCKRFAAFSGSSSLTIGCTGSRDPLFQQLYPTTSWGKDYGVTPPANRKYNLRILAAEDHTIVTVNGAIVGTINRGQKIDLVNQIGELFVSSNKIVSVAQYLLTQACSSQSNSSIIGDPDMVILNPIEFNIKKITVFSADKQAITQRYINVVMKTDKAATFKINGAMPSGTWTPISSKPEYAYIQIAVFDASLTLEADDGFNAIAFGFGEYESYAYSAGTNLASNQYVTVVNKQTLSRNSSACLFQASDLEVTLPHLLKKIIWKYDDGTADYIDNNPNPTVSTNSAGQTLYTYYSPANKAFNTVGERTLIAIGTFNNSSNPCFGSEAEFTFTFNVEPFPTAAFSVSSTNCPDSPIAFSDSSTSNVDGKSIVKWLWDFGDGTVETKTNKTNVYHAYTAKGSFLAKLIVYTETGCASDVFNKTITINEKISPAFNVVGVGCVDKPSIFKDMSSIDVGGLITARIWDMGDGSAPITVNDASYSYTYSRTGTFVVKMTAMSNLGCSSGVVSKTVTVSALPVPLFDKSDFCLADGAASFTNKSTIFDGSPLTYIWDFGDANSNASKPNTSTVKNPSHSYSATGNYLVKLTVTSIYGCSEVFSDTFTVNGAVTEANFDVTNNGACSGNDILIRNTSQVAFGSVSKVHVYRDFQNNPNEFFTISNPADNLIPLVYPKFGGLSDRVYRIKLIAYSGESCSKEITKEVVIHPTPQLTFSNIPPVCFDDGSVTLTQAAEISGMIGVGNYSGAGIEDGKKFDPKIAGEGTHIITYTFTSDKSCVQTATQTLVVNRSPSISMPAGFSIFAGGSKVIEALVDARSSSVTYQWSPSLGLDDSTILKPTASPTRDTEYTLLVTTSNGCTSVAKILVKVLEDIKPPNTFTPNGDNINDVWNIPYLDSYPHAEVEIFNRNGEKIFKSKGYKIPFDGTHNSQQLPVGTYFYIIHPNSGRNPVTGILTLIR